MKIMWCSVCQDDLLCIRLRETEMEHDGTYAIVYECSKCGGKVYDWHNPEDDTEFNGLRNFGESGEMWF